MWSVPVLTEKLQGTNDKLRSFIVLEDDGIGVSSSLHHCFCNSKMNKTVKESLTGPEYATFRQKDTLRENRNRVIISSCSFTRY